MRLSNRAMSIEITGGTRYLWRYRVAASGYVVDIAPPQFEIDGALREATLDDIMPSGPAHRLPNGCTEYGYVGRFIAQPNLSLELIFRVADDSPIVRFRYRLTSAGGHVLTKSTGTDSLTYLRTSFHDLRHATEIRFSEFVPLVHSYCLAERPLDDRYFEDEVTAMGPVLVGMGNEHALLVAYEHGSHVPDAFLHFHLAADRDVALRAVKGNYAHGHALTTTAPFETVWLQVGAIVGDEERLAATYRAFVLDDMSLSRASRTPYIFYNTWAFQERNKWWNGQTFLASMCEERIRREIDVAHRMGIEVFVIDTGWYEKTGDWEVSRERFPVGLRRIKEQLDTHGMRLGLWFGPTSAALSSRAYRNNRSCVMAWRGREYPPHPVWETEESQAMCLVSSYADAFADSLIRLARELGVTYFKWDAVNQYGCDSPDHWHGTRAHAPEERADRYAFELPRAMTRVVERLSAACPEAIVDFDVTEGGRAVGLGFLAAGKYFLINNGPYYQDYDVPIDRDTQNTNLFFYPGPARTWVCRAPLAIDKWLPSVLFLTHYLPDDPVTSQHINIASLVLGQNGIWGDLLAVSSGGVQVFARLLGLYKQVRADATGRAAIRSGMVGGSPEIYEKISEATGRGLIVAFSPTKGRYAYVSRTPVASPYWASDGASVSVDTRGRATIDFTFEREGACIAFFGVQP